MFWMVFLRDLIGMLLTLFHWKTVVWGLRARIAWKAACDSLSASRYAVSVITRALDVFPIFCSHYSLLDSAAYMCP
jgi:hypothetical protein